MIGYVKSSSALGYLIGFTAFLGPILGFVSPKGLAPLVIIGSIFSVLILWGQGRKIKWLGLPASLILVCFCLWALLSSLWSVDPISSITGSARLFGNILVGGLLFATIKNLSIEEKKLILKFFFSGFFIAIGLVFLEILLGGPIIIMLKGIYIQHHGVSGIFWLSPFVVVLCLFIWPIALGIYKKRSFGVMDKYPLLCITSGFIVILILSVIISFSSGIFALVCGIFGSVLVLICGRRAAVLASVMLAIVSFSLPFGFNMLQDPISQINSLIPLPTSAEHRIGIWKFTSRKASENPIIGWGMNASKNIPGGRAFIFSKDGKQYGRALPLHPHNAILQIWLELGLPGIILFVGLCIFVIMASVNRIYLKFESAAIFGQFVTILAISNLSFGMWQAWWIALIWLSAGFMALITNMDNGADL
ncbi:O-antigen ligase family protein [Gammaproteobacteria bacterium]|nr:O-antigen ligase family protein [Gammaproteobacteria bacterium]